MGPSTGIVVHLVFSVSSSHVGTVPDRTEIPRPALEVTSPHPMPCKLPVKSPGGYLHPTPGRIDWQSESTVGLVREHVNE